MDIRPETEGDTDSIRRLTTAAFAGAAHSSGTEAAIIDRLRDTGSLVLSLVGGFEGRIVAHVAFSPVRIGGQDLGWVGLGPVSVWPEQQGRGLGRAVIAEGLRRVAEQGGLDASSWATPPITAALGLRRTPACALPARRPNISCACALPAPCRPAM